LLLKIFLLFIECGGTIELTSQKPYELKSPFYPQNYPRKRYCKWTFHAEEFQLITIRFSDLVIEPHQFCQNDKISVETGKSTFTTCGNEEPYPITSVVNRMVVTFETDGDGDFRGFKAMVSVAEHGIFICYLNLLFL